MRGGTPSTTTPIAGPWLSPQVVKRNSVPKLLPAMLTRLLLTARWRELDELRGPLTLVRHRDVRRVDAFMPTT